MNWKLQIYHQKPGKVFSFMKIFMIPDPPLKTCYQKENLLSTQEISGIKKLFITDGSGCCIRI